MDRADALIITLEEEAKITTSVRFALDSKDSKRLQVALGDAAKVLAIPLLPILEAP